MLYYSTLIYIMIYYFKPGIRWPVLNPFRLELVIGSIILVAVLLQNRNNVLRIDKMNKAIMLFFLSLCVSFFGAFWTHTASHAIDVFIEVLKNFALYVMIIGTIDSKKKLYGFIAVYTGTIVFHFCEPFVWSLHGNGFRHGTIHLEGFGDFGQYNQLGALTLTNLAFVLGLISYHRNIIVRTGLLMCGLIGLRVIMLTGSRTAYIGFIVFILIIILRSKKKVILFIAATFGMLFLLTVMPPQYRDRFMSLGATKNVVEGQQINDSIYTRWIIIKDAWAIFLDYPVIGAGLDSFYQLRGDRYNRWQPSHNMLLQILTNTGLVGLCAFSFLIYTIYFYLRAAEAIVKNRKRNLIFCMSQAVFLFLSTRLAVVFFGHSLYTNYWWLSAGLAKVLYLLARKEKEKEMERLIQQRN